MLTLLAPLTLAVTLPSTVAPQAGGPSLEEFAASLSFETGSVSVAGGDVTFDLPAGWALLQSRDARRVVEELWGNPPNASILAFVDPPSPAGRLESDFGVIVTLDSSGFVSDEDAAGLDYDDLLRDMQQDTRDSNEARMEAGYGTIELLGWAEPPHYDAGEKKLYWAKELRFDGSAETTLNYDVRILGRRGYLQLKAVAPMEAIDEVHGGMTSLVPVTNFTAGSRYSDFDSSIDKVAAYGIGGLIAGKVAAKAGLFALIAKFGKVIALGAVALFVGAKKFLFGGGANSDSDIEAEPSAEA
ncbi:MAG: DUF2167 domain-containing protein [Planctomycetota bacterium]